MNVLVVSSRPPAPVVKGDQLIIVNRLRELRARGHRLFLCYVHAGSDPPAGAEEVAPHCEAVYPHRIGALRRGLNLLGRGALGPLPLQVALYLDAGLARRVREIVARERIDVVNAFLLRPFPAVERVDAPVVVDLVDSMLLNVRRRMATAPWWLRPVLAVEARRLARYERLVCERAGASLVVARADRDAIGGPRTFVVPNGVDAREFHPDPAARVPGRVVFSGNLRYHANRVALAWFVGECWPALRERFPGAELCVAGFGAEAVAPACAAAPGVRVVGRVPSMGDFLRTADVAVAPMRSGSGMQNKVLEAMACGVPTVVSGLGLGDIQATDGVETLVADDPGAFVDAVSTLLAYPARRDAVSRAALALVRRAHTWERNASEFERIALAAAAERERSATAAA